MRRGVTLTCAQRSGRDRKRQRESKNLGAAGDETTARAGLFFQSIPIWCRCINAPSQTRAKRGLRRRLGRYLLPATRTFLDIGIVGIRARAVVPVRRPLCRSCVPRAGFDVCRGRVWCREIWRVIVVVGIRRRVVIPRRNNRRANKHTRAEARNEVTAACMMPAVTAEMARMTRPVTPTVAAPRATSSAASSKRIGCHN